MGSLLKWYGMFKEIARKGKHDLKNLGVVCKSEDKLGKALSQRYNLCQQ